MRGRENDANLGHCQFDLLHHLRHLIDNGTKDTEEGEQKVYMKFTLFHAFPKLIFFIVLVIQKNNYDFLKVNFS